MAAVIKSIRGTRDLLPPETALWNFAEAAVRDVFRVYNFHEIRTPVIEDLQLFQRSVGEETDIVAKEMFWWDDDRRAPEIRLEALWFDALSPTIDDIVAPPSFPGLQYQPKYRVTPPKRE